MPKRSLVKSHILKNMIDPAKVASPKYARVPDDPKAHHGPGAGRFNNPWESFHNYTLLQFAPMIKEYNRQRTAMPAELAVKMRPLDWERIDNPPADKVQATWLGHAAFLIQIDGKRILCDPICSYRCSPLSFLGPARYTPSPLTATELRERVRPDIVVISHNHYDHLDVATMRALGPDITYMVPLGNKDWFKSFDFPHVYECDWWDTHTIAGLQITCTPCQHFTGRVSLFLLSLLLYWICNKHNQIGDL
jgi:N-acyl-phosphatidylethanolamine-hydrolysing phospholipase D